MRVLSEGSNQGWVGVGAGPLGWLQAVSTAPQAMLFEKSEEDRLWGAAVGNSVYLAETSQERRGKTRKRKEGCLALQPTLLRQECDKKHAKGPGSKMLQLWPLVFQCMTRHNQLSHCMWQAGRAHAISTVCSLWWCHCQTNQHIILLLWLLRAQVTNWQPLCFFCLDFVAF